MSTYIWNVKSWCVIMMMLINGSCYCFCLAPTKASNHHERHRNGLVRPNGAAFKSSQKRLNFLNIFLPPTAPPLFVPVFRRLFFINAFLLHFFGCSTFFKLLVSEEYLLLSPFNSETMQAQENSKSTGNGLISVSCYRKGGSKS